MRQVSALLEEIKRHRQVSDESSLTAEACLSHDAEHLSRLLRDGTRSLDGWFRHWINYVLERRPFEWSERVNGCFRYFLCWKHTLL
ncbi:hypothetical protein CDAR_504531 [Caerostris darwini]|uniref:Uncharacterized protein n=1 Tax=Caerostris darwini TaxID=1538125 RepID=A0AAV4SAC8_9ARAC|nr:hypothetical protein CDAR_504531 [Caerostris darwini]